MKKSTLGVRCTRAGQGRGRKEKVLSYRKAAAARAQMMRVLHWKLGAGKENGSAADLIGKMSSAPTSTNAVHDLPNLIVLS